MSAHVRTYFIVFVALLILTYATVEVAGIHLGIWNVPVALAIACTKASVIGLWFMHLKKSPALTKLSVIAAMVWFIVLIGMTIGDYLTRGW
jgi:cytochrome c oxidase subunit 4